MRIYIETSVLSSIVGKDLNIKLKSKKLLVKIKSGEHSGYISKLVIDEIKKSPKKFETIKKILSPLPIKTLKISDNARSLAINYLDAKIIPKKVAADSLHIAIAVVNKMDALVSWNFAHIVNINTIKKVNEINIKKGYSYIVIVTPDEVK